MQALSETRAEHAGHHLIGDDECVSSRIRRHEGERLTCIGAGVREVTDVVKHLLADVDQGSFVVDEENPFAGSPMVY